MNLIFDRLSDKTLQVLRKGNESLLGFLNLNEGQYEFTKEPKEKLTADEYQEIMSWALDNEVCVMKETRVSKRKKKSRKKS